MTDTSEPTVNDPIDRVQRAQRTAALRSDLQHRALAHEDRLLDSLIRSYRGGILTHDQMVGAIGGLDALRMLIEEVESEAKQSAAADIHSLTG